MKLPQSPSGFTGKLFGKLMELTNADAYNKGGVYTYIETHIPLVKETIL
jgi:hypothetical protein